MRNSPEQGSPSEKSISPGENDFKAVRAARNSISGSVSALNRGAALRTPAILGRVEVIDSILAPLAPNKQPANTARD
jgi:hypothetical protein